MRLHHVAFALVASVAWATAAAAPGLEAVPEEGGVHVRVEKRGLFSAFAHDHDFEVTRWHGTADVPGDDPARATLELFLDAASLRDREKGLSAGDREKVEKQTAGPEVLDAAHAPEIVYRAAGATLEPARAGAGADTVRGTLHGKLTLHGETHPVDATFEARRDGGAWHVHGKARFRQSEFGMKPFTGAGGTVGVKDEVEVVFTIGLRAGVT